MFPVRDFSDSFKVVVRVGRGLGGRVRVCRGDRVRVARLGAIGSARSAAGAIGSGWIDRVGSAGSGRSGGGGDRVRVGRSIRFYWIGAVWRRGRSGSGGSIRFYGIATFSGWAIGSEWIDRPGSTGSARSAAGRSGPGGSIDRVYLDRYSQRVGDPVRMDRSRSMGSTGIFPQTPRFNPRKNSIQPANSPETTIPRPQPAEKRH